MLKKYLFPPGVKALAPINPARLGSYAAGSVLSSDLSISMDLISKPIDNIGMAVNYMRDGHNVTHILRRAGEVSMDTVRVNLMAESMPVVGPAMAGQYANEAAQKYAEKVVTDYKLVDSVKQKALKQRWLRRYGKAGKFKATAWRGAPGGGYNGSSTFYADPSAWNTPGTGPLDYRQINTNTTSHRFRWIKRFRGGGQVEISRNIGLKVQLFMISFFQFLRQHRSLILFGIAYICYSKFISSLIYRKSPLFSKYSVRVEHG